MSQYQSSKADHAIASTYVRAGWVTLKSILLLPVVYVTVAFLGVIIAAAFSGGIGGIGGGAEAWLGATAMVGYFGAPIVAPITFLVSFMIVTRWVMRM